MTRAKTHTALATAGLILLIGLAGCMADSTQDSVSFDSYEEAKSAQGETYEPDANGSDAQGVMLKLLVPSDPQSAPEGKQPIAFLLYDSQNDTPVTDAAVQVESRMPAMGHGTTDEVDPSHQDHGVYQGQTNHMMPGSWVVKVDAETAEGVLYQYEIEFRVA